MDPKTVTLLDETQSQALASILEEHIYKFNAEATGYFDGKSLGGSVRDEAGTVIAGFTGHTWGGCGVLTYVWVSKAHRGSGLGRTLLQSAEAEALKRGCVQMVLATHSFQAPGFYEANGYARKYEIEGQPKGHSDIIYAKKL